MDGLFESGIISVVNEREIKMLSIRASAWLLIRFATIVYCLDVRGRESAPTQLEFQEIYVQRIKSYMNTTVQPCDDFYEYACGNYEHVIDDLELPYKRNNILDNFFVLADVADRALQRERQPNERYYEELQIAKRFLESCVKAKHYPMEPSEEYLEVLRSIGGFPANDPFWSDSSFDWLEMTGHLTRYGVDGLVRERISPKHPFPPYYELPKLGFDFDVNLENIESDGYEHNENVMRNLLNTYRVTGTRSERVILDIFDFWNEVLHIEKQVKEHDNCSLNHTHDGKSVDEWPRWKRFLAVAWNTTHFNMTSESDCPCHNFYHLLDGVISRRPKAAANYMALKFLHTMHLGFQAEKHKRLHCLLRVKLYLPVILSHFFMKEDYIEESTLDIFNIISELKKSLLHLIAIAEWLDPLTKLKTRDELKSLHVRVGRMDHPIFDTYIKLMRNLNITDNFPENNLQLSRFSVDISHYGYLHPEEDTLDLTSSDLTQVNAFYNGMNNSINVMGGLLYPPIYHPSLPDSVKYGSVGYLLGHEFTHSLYLETEGYDSDCAEMMQERTKCFADHYSRYGQLELNHEIDGQVSQGENVADSGGLRQAFIAYKEGLRDNSSEAESLPGLDLSPEQTFFLSFAQFYCSQYKPNNFWAEVYYTYPLDKYRVIGALQNYEEFSRAYKCAAGSAMNPRDKCRLW